MSVTTSEKPGGQKARFMDRQGPAAGIIRVLVRGVSNTFRYLLALVLRMTRFVEDWLFSRLKAQYGTAVTRMLLAGAGLGMLLTNWSTRYYTSGTGGAWSGDLANPGSDFPTIWIFSIFQTFRTDDFIFSSLYLLTIVLGVCVLIGYRTRLTMLLFFIMYVSYIELQEMAGDQGDNIFRIAMLGLLFADTSSKWSIDARRRLAPRASSSNVLVRLWAGGLVLPDWLRNMSHNLVLVVLMLQVSMVYASGAFYKAGGLPWQNGSALYYPISVDQFGPWPQISAIVTAWAPLVAALTYLTVIAQAFFPVLLMNEWTRRIALIVICGFHLGIAVLMGLPWFSLAMIAIDAIFVRDVTWKGLSGWVTRQYRNDPALAVPARA